MERIRVAACLLIRIKHGKLYCLILFQVDDRLGMRTEESQEDEGRPSKMFQSKPRKKLDDIEQDFTGTTLRREHGRTLSWDQDMKIDRFTEPTTPNTFRSQGALAQYIALSARPDICTGQFNSWRLAQKRRSTRPTKS